MYILSADNRITPRTCCAVDKNATRHTHTRDSTGQKRSGRLGVILAVVEIVFLRIASRSRQHIASLVSLSVCANVVTIISGNGSSSSSMDTLHKLV